MAMVAVVAVIEVVVVVITSEHVGARGAARKGCEIGQRVVI